MPLPLAPPAPCTPFGVPLGLLSLAGGCSFFFRRPFLLFAWSWAWAELVLFPPPSVVRGLVQSLDM
eukprot:6262157-Prorocentrum_lima.AAC.1